MSSLPAAENLYDANTAARNALDEEISQLEARLISLRRTRNGLAPIARIHSEILQEIFTLTSRSSTKHGKAALLVTWISHDWRNLAHQTSDLWSQIDFINTEWIEAALSRTKDRRLELIFASIVPEKEHRIPALISLCFGNLFRMKTLHILFGNKRDFTSQFPANIDEWTIPAPVLEELKLSAVDAKPAEVTP